MRFKLTSLVLVFLWFVQCSQTESIKAGDLTSVFPLEVGTTWIYKNLVYHLADTNCVMDTICITGKYKDYFIEETTHADWTGISFVKYLDNKYILYGRVGNSDTVFYEYPIVLGYMNGITGDVDSDSLMKNEKVSCRESLNITIIPDYTVLGEIDTVYCHYFTSTCPDVSHRYDYYSKKYGLVYNKAIQRNRGNIVQEIILEKIIKKHKQK